MKQGIRTHSPVGRRKEKKAARLSRRSIKLESKAKQAKKAGKSNKAARLSRRSTKLKSKAKQARLI